MDHHRSGPVVGAVGVREIEVLRLGEVDLKGGDLPTAADGRQNRVRLSLVYLAAQDNGLIIFSVEDPTHPVRLAHFGPETTEPCH